MLKPFKGREIDLSKPVRVYRNLNRKCWSIRQNQLIVAHATTLELADVKPIVSARGRERVVNEGRKNVHAFMEGMLVECDDDYVIVNKVTYNPYKHEGFVNMDGSSYLGSSYMFFGRSMSAYPMEKKIGTELKK